MEVDEEDGCIFFSGKPREGDIAHQAAQRGIHLRRFDLLHAGAAEDITRDLVFMEVMQKLRARRWRFVAMAIPCRSFSPARRKRIRVKGMPWGATAGMDARQRRFLQRENLIIERALQILELALELNLEVVFEHPAKTNEKGLKFYDRRAKRCASIFDLPWLERLVKEHHLAFVEFPQRAFLGLTLKPTRLLFTPFLSPILAPLDNLLSEQRSGGHALGNAYGRDARGRSISALTAAYPFALCTVFVDCAALVLGLSLSRLRSPVRPPLLHPPPPPLAEDSDSDMPGLVSIDDSSGDEPERTPALRRQVRLDTDISGGEEDSCVGTHRMVRGHTGEATSGTSGDDCPPTGGSSLMDAGEQERVVTESTSGKASTGPMLSAAVQAAIQEARHHPPPFASQRHTVPASLEELEGRPVRDDSGMIDGLLQRHPPLTPRSAGQPFGHPPPDLQRLPSGPIPIHALFMPGVWERVIAWFEAADTAMEALLEGKFQSPGTLVITQEELQPWARGILWDCSDPQCCVPARPSTQADLPSLRGRKIDAAVLRAMADEIGWDDPDILNQADNGFEAYSKCSLTTVLAFHHTGVSQHYAAAEKVIEADLHEGWITPAVRWLPRLPLRCLARNVIVTQKARVAPDGASLEHYSKTRVSTDAGESSSPDSPNAGISKAETSLELCSAKDMGVGTAVVSIPSGGLSKVGMAVIDLESAFRFLLVQWLDLWLHAFLWWTARRAVAEAWCARKAGICLDLRVDFGGAAHPNRFQRVMLIVKSFISFKLRQFDLAHPLPPLAREWQQRRRVLQADGRLPSGQGQCDPHYEQVYLDDLGITGGTDMVMVPDDLEGIVVGGVQPGCREEDLVEDPITGGRPLVRECRIHVYCLIAVALIDTLGFSCSFSKTTVANRVILLGLRLRPADGIVDCPELKAQVMIEALISLVATVEQGRSVDLEDLERLVGRLGNIAQIYCAIKLWLAAGYALIRLRYRSRPSRRGFRRLVKTVTLKRAGRRERELLQLCRVALQELRENRGAPLAAQAVFPSATDDDVAVVVTDASGIHGVGGYAVVSSRPSVVWLVSEWWPDDILAALAEMATPQAQRAGGLRLAMPSAELFGAVAVADALRRRAFLATVIAVGDCLPAVRALNASTSSSAQMRSLIRVARAGEEQWLAVHVHREFNVDADRLSHPSNYWEVESEVRAAGFTPVRLRLSTTMWGELTSALRLPLAVDELLPQFA